MPKEKKTKEMKKTNEDKARRSGQKPFGRKKDQRNWFSVCCRFVPVSLRNGRAFLGRNPRKFFRSCGMSNSYKSQNYWHAQPLGGFKALGGIAALPAASGGKQSPTSAPTSEATKNLESPSPSPRSEIDKQSSRKLPECSQKAC